MSLESGQYYIYTAAGGFPLGRKPVEKPIFGAPRGIFKLPEGTDSVWEAERLDNGTYKFRNRGGIVGGIAAEHLFAYPGREGHFVGTSEWVLRRDVLNADNNAYVITMANVDDPNAWIVQEPDNISDVVLRPFIVGLSNPPTYPPNKVFIFKKVDA